MSLAPGIGALMVPSLVATLESREGSMAISRTGGVPESLSHGRKQYPLGRYLRGKVCEALDIDKGTFRQAQQAEEMRALRKASGNTAFAALKPFVEHQRILQIETRAKIWSKKGQI